MNLNEQEKKKRKVRISCIYHARPKHDPGAPLTLHASLYDAEECGELMVSAILDYIINACNEHDYIIVR